MFSANRLRRELDRLGMVVRFDLHGEYTVIRTAFPSEYVRDGIRTLAEILYSPTFETLAVEDEKERILSEAGRLSADTERFVETNFQSLLYGGARADLSALRTGLASVERKDLKQFHERTVSSASVVLSVTGDFFAETLKDQLDEKFDIARSAQVETPELQSSPLKPGVHFFPMRASVACAAAGRRTVNLENAKYPAFEVLGEVLAGGRPCRLHNPFCLAPPRFRVRLGLAPLAVGEGAMHIRILSQPEDAPRALRRVLDEVGKILKSPLPAEDVQIARKRVRSRVQGLFASLGAVCDTFASLEIRGLPADFYRAFLERLRAVTPNDVKWAASALFPGGKTFVVLAGEKNRIALGEMESGVELKSLGTVHEYGSK
jgi:predicted Zn-dependent peptidase